MMRNSNPVVSMAGLDLGLGEMVARHMDEQEKERRNKMLQMQKAAGQSQAARDLFGPGQKMMPDA